MAETVCDEGVHKLVQLEVGCAAVDAVPEVLLAFGGGGAPGLVDEPARDEVVMYELTGPGFEDELREYLEDVFLDYVAEVVVVPAGGEGRVGVVG